MEPALFDRITRLVALKADRRILVVSALSALLKKQDSALSQVSGDDPNCFAPDRRCDNNPAMWFRRNTCKLCCSGYPVKDGQNWVCGCTPQGSGCGTSLACCGELTCDYGLCGGPAPTATAVPENPLPVESAPSEPPPTETVPPEAPPAVTATPGPQGPQMRVRVECGSSPEHTYIKNTGTSPLKLLSMRSLFEARGDVEFDFQGYVLAPGVTIDVQTGAGASGPFKSANEIYNNEEREEGVVVRSESGSVTVKCP